MISKEELQELMLQQEAELELPSAANAANATNAASAVSTTSAAAYAHDIAAATDTATSTCGEETVTTESDDDTDEAVYHHVYLLVDCNNFFASCERLFRPDLEGKPILVLSNNDGCVVARSYETKALGIPMGIPVFKIKDIIEHEHIVCFSSNFNLYRDISNRVMALLSRFSPHIEVYSVDEAFLRFANITASEAIAHATKIRMAVAHMLGIQVGIGIAATKTLAKLANHHAKSHVPNTGGIYSILEEIPRIQLLKQSPIEEIWGVGRKLTTKLKDQHLMTAYQLSLLDHNKMRRSFGLHLMRTILELNNIPARANESHDKEQQSIMWSRSFSKRLTTMEEIHTALANYAAAAAQKLRQQLQYCRSITVNLRTSYFGDAPKYAAEKTFKLKIPTADTREIIAIATNLLMDIYRSGFAYSKVGIVLHDLTRDRSFQHNLVGGSNSDELSESESHSQAPYADAEAGTDTDANTTARAGADNGASAGTGARASADESSSSPHESNSNSDSKTTSKLHDSGTSVLKAEDTTNGSGNENSNGDGYGSNGSSDGYGSSDNTDGNAGTVADSVPTKKLAIVDIKKEQERSDKLMAAIDQINSGLDKPLLFWASQGLSPTQTLSQRKSLSPAYTTDFNNLPRIE